MSLFSRIKSIFTKTPKKQEPSQPRPHKVFDQPISQRPKANEWDEWWPEPVTNVWDDFKNAIGKEPGKNVKAAFDSGWIDPTESHIGRVEARQSLFAYMRRMAVDISEFPWAEWRDWYEST